jgi:hypothetical protein
MSWAKQCLLSLVTYCLEFWSEDEAGEDQEEEDDEGEEEDDGLGESKVLDC